MEVMFWGNVKKNKSILLKYTINDDHVVLYIWAIMMMEDMVGCSEWFFRSDSLCVVAHTLAIVWLEVARQRVGYGGQVPSEVVVYQV